MFSVDYAAGKLFVVNGPEVSKAHAVGGFAIDMNSGTVVEKFGSFSNPHDLAVSSDASEVYLLFQTYSNIKFKLFLRFTLLKSVLIRSINSF